MLGSCLQKPVQALRKLVNIDSCFLFIMLLRKKSNALHVILMVNILLVVYIVIVKCLMNIHSLVSKCVIFEKNFEITVLTPYTES